MHLTQHKLAKRVGCAKKTIENAEASKSCLLRTLDEIATALQVDVGEIRFVESDDNDVASHTAGSDPRATAYDVIVVSQASDRRVIEKLARGLLEFGVRPWLDKWCLHGNQLWREQAREALKSIFAQVDGAVRQSPAPGFIFCIDDGGWPPWLDWEIAALIEDFMGNHVCEALVVALCESASGAELPSSLQAVKRVDLWRNFNSSLVEIREQFPPRPGAAAWEHVCPYPGLLPFQRQDSQWMLGRDDEVADNLRKLGDDNCMLFLVGASGCGKSSLVLAGLLPELLAGGMDGSHDWCAVVMRPGSEPCQELATALIPLVKRSALSVEPVGAIAPLHEQLISSENALANTICEQLPSRLVVVIDQFEEVFTRCSTPAGFLNDDARAFVNNLLTATESCQGNIRVIATLRADFVGACLDTPRLNERFMSAATYTVTPLKEERLRCSISAPARYAGVTIEPAVIEALICGMHGQPGRLPLLQHALAELWKKRNRAQRLMTEASYRAIGGIEGSVANKADAILAEMSSEQQCAARQIFRRLVSPGEGTGDTRRRASWSEFEDARSRAVLSRFIDARLITSDEGTVEIAHEALISAWEKLKGWVNQDREAFRLQHDLARSAAAWLGSGRKPEHLWRSGQFQRALEFVQSEALLPSDQEERFLRASRAARARSLRLRSGLVVAVMAVVTVFGIWALYERNDAQTQRARAQSNHYSTMKAAVTHAVEDAAIRDPTLAATLLREPWMPHLVEDWRSLATRTLQRPIAEAVLVGHENAVYSIAYTPDNQHLVSGSWDKTIRIWNSQYPHQSHLLQGDGSAVTSLTFSSDGNEFAAGMSSGAVYVWNRDSGTLKLQLDGHRLSVLSVAFDLRGERILTASLDGSVRLWDAVSGNQLATMGFSGKKDDETEDVRFASFLAGDESIIFASDRGNIGIQRIADGALHIESIGGLSESWALSPKQDVVATSEGTRVSLWDFKSMKRIRVIGGARGFITRVSFDPRGEQIAVPTFDGTTAVWAASTATQIVADLEHDDPVLEAAFSADGSHLATGSADLTVRLWNLDQRKRDCLWIAGESRAVSISRDGTILAMARLNASLNGVSSIKVYRLDECRMVSEISTPTAPFWVSVSPDGKLLAFVLDGGSVAIARTESSEFRVVGTHQVDPMHVAFNPDGTLVVTGADDGTVNLWSVDGSSALRTFRPHTNSVTSVSFSPDGEYVATASLDGTAQVLRLDGGIVQIFRHNDSVAYTSWSPYGRQIATASGDGLIRIWDLGERVPRATLRGHRGRVSSVVYSPDGRYLLSAGWLDRTVRLWDAHEHEQLLLLPDFSSVLWFASFTPDGKHVIVPSLADPTRLWPIDEPSVLVERLWQATSYCLSPAQRQRYLYEDSIAAEANNRCCQRRVEIVQAGGRASKISCGIRPVSVRGALQ